MDKPFQRSGAESNAHAGRDFEDAALKFFAEKEELHLQRGVDIQVGIKTKKSHKFDLGCKRTKVIVECKSHKWTVGRKVPSAKITTWNEAMYYFYLVPEEYRKIFFVLRDVRQNNGETLAAYYLRTQAHLVPCDVEFWEYSEAEHTAKRIK